MFRIVGLPLAPFTPLFALSDEALEARGARRVRIDQPNTAPCRVSLADAEPGGTCVLLNFTHLDVPASPYRAAGPIFVSETARQHTPEPGEIPDMLGRRLISARLYDDQAMMIDADVTEGRDLAARLSAWLDDPAVADIHLHTARRGCFMARAVRA